MVVGYHHFRKHPYTAKFTRGPLEDTAHPGWKGSEAQKSQGAAACQCVTEKTSGRVRFLSCAQRLGKKKGKFQKAQGLHSKNPFLCPKGLLRGSGYLVSG